jgi:hypothetical protein
MQNIDSAWFSSGGFLQSIHSKGVNGQNILSKGVRPGFWPGLALSGLLFLFY